MKLLIWLGVMIGGTIGGWVGAAMTHGNWFSVTSILLGGVGSLAGIWVGFKIGQNL
ncbi:MAG TPA: hypothetical protein VGG13_03935 [Candidatus Saccharimonadales bacterium]|jgi:hypothetical protein